MARVSFSYQNEMILTSFTFLLTDAAFYHFDYFIVFIVEKGI